MDEELILPVSLNAAASTSESIFEKETMAEVKFVEAGRYE